MMALGSVSSCSHPKKLVISSSEAPEWVASMRNMLEKSENIDCVVACEDGCVGMHSLVLLAASPVMRLQASSSGHLLSSKCPHHICDGKLRHWDAAVFGIRKETFLVLLQWLYNSNCIVSHMRQIFEIASAARSLEISALQTTIFNVVHNEISVSNCPEICNLSRQHGFAELGRMALTYCAERFELVAQHSTFATLRIEVLEDLLSEEALFKCQDFVVLDAICTWIQHQRSDHVHQHAERLLRDERFMRLRQLNASSDRKAKTSPDQRANTSSDRGADRTEAPSPSKEQHSPTKETNAEQKSELKSLLENSQQTAFLHATLRQTWVTGPHSAMIAGPMSGQLGHNHAPHMNQQHHPAPRPGLKHPPTPPSRAQLERQGSQTASARAHPSAAHVLLLSRAQTARAHTHTQAPSPLVAKSHAINPPRKHTPTGERRSQPTRLLCHASPELTARMARPDVRTRPELLMKRARRAADARRLAAAGKLPLRAYAICLRVRY